jgi:hypothetical protein
MALSSEHRLAAPTRLGRLLVLDALRMVTVAGNVLMHAVHLLETWRNARRCRQDGHPRA